MNSQTMNFDNFRKNNIATNKKDRDASKFNKDFPESYPVVLIPYSWHLEDNDLCGVYSFPNKYSSGDKKSTIFLINFLKTLGCPSDLAFLISKAISVRWTENEGFQIRTKKDDNKNDMLLKAIENDLSDMPKKEQKNWIVSLLHAISEHYNDFYK